MASSRKISRPSSSTRSPTARRIPHPALRPLLFLTSNKHKFAEAQTLLKSHGIEIASVPAKGTEIQSDSLVQVAATCAESAYKRLRRPLFVEDSGLFIEKLNGFPGVYSSAAYDQLGCAGILRLLGQQRQRAAKFMCAIAYVDSQGTRIFRGVVHGRIAKRASPASGFGFDPLFIARGYSKPFSLTPHAKAKLSHRVKALQALAKFLGGRKKRV